MYILEAITFSLQVFIYMSNNNKHFLKAQYLEYKH